MIPIAKAAVKVHNCIASCTTREQILAADNLISNFRRLYCLYMGYRHFTKELHKQIQVKRIEIFHLQNCLTDK